MSTTDCPVTGLGGEFDPFAGDSFEELPREEFTDEDDDMPDALPAKKRAGGKKRR